MESRYKGIIVGREFDQDFLISLLAVIETTIRQSPALANIVSQLDIFNNVVVVFRI
jgi:hypothetical protein